MRRLGLAALTLVALLSTAGHAHACTGEQPTFAEAIAGAEAIARVAVADVTEYGEPPAGETFRVIRVLKGALPDEVNLDDPRTDLCGDTVGHYAPEGTDAIVAFGVPFYDTLVNPAWILTDDPLRPVSGFGTTAPESVASLDELEQLILAAIPNTALAPPATNDVTLIGGVALLLVAVAVLHRRIRRA
jgi:hypothetical protein